jgi:hypothetical protein
VRLVPTKRMTGRGAAVVGDGSAEADGEPAGVGPEPPPQAEAAAERASRSDT